MTVSVKPSVYNAQLIGIFDFFILVLYLQELYYARIAALVWIKVVDRIDLRSLLSGHRTQELVSHLSHMLVPSVVATKSAG